MGCDFPLGLAVVKHLHGSYGINVPDSEASLAFA